VITEEQRKLKGIKRINKNKKLKQLASFHLKLLGDGHPKQLDCHGPLFHNHPNYHA
jgi:hypothetical protein